MSLTTRGLYSRWKCPASRISTTTLVASAGVEPNGALWNPDVRGRLVRLAALHERLVAHESIDEAAARPLRRRQGAVLESVTAIVEQAKGPIRVREVHAAVEELFGEEVPLSSVSEALSTHAIGSDQRFRRVRYGIYEMGRLPNHGESAATATS